MGAGGHGGILANEDEGHGARPQKNKQSHVWFFCLGRGLAFKHESLIATVGFDTAENEPVIADFPVRSFTSAVVPRWSSGRKG